MKAYMGSRVIAALIPNLSIGWRPVVIFAPQPLCTWERIFVPNGEEVGWALEPVLTYWSGEKISWLYRDSISRVTSQ